MTNHNKIACLVGGLLALIALSFFYVASRKAASGDENRLPGSGGGKHVTPSESAPLTQSSRQKGADGARQSTKRDTDPEVQVSLTGLLPTSAAAKFRLTDDQVRSCQMIVSRFWAEGQAWFNRKCYLDEGASVAGIDVYRIPAMPEAEREMLLNSLRGDLEHAGNSQFATAVVDSVNGSEAFAGFGRYDAVLEFSPRIIGILDLDSNKIEEKIDYGNAAVSYTFTDPTTGSVLLKSTGGDLGSIEPIFGKFKLVGSE